MAARSRLYPEAKRTNGPVSSETENCTVDGATPLVQMVPESDRMEEGTLGLVNFVSSHASQGPSWVVRRRTIGCVPVFLDQPPGPSGRILLLGAAARLQLKAEVTCATI
jgi:hypothetical protein